MQNDGLSKINNIIFIMIKAVLKVYFKIYRVVAAKRLSRKDVQEIWIHADLACVLTTAILMWAYAFLAYFTIDHPLPGLVGFGASTIHLVSPLLYRITSNRYFVTNVYLFAGIIHQATFAFFTGGHGSPVLIWLGILPMLAGLCSGAKGILHWATITTSVVAVFFAAAFQGFVYPELITPTGMLVAQLLICFGWIFISSTVIFVFIKLIQGSQNQLEKKNVNIQHLVNVLTHDITNSISVIKWICELFEEHQKLDEEAKAFVKKGQIHSDNIVDVISSVREIYTCELNETELPVETVNLHKLWGDLSNLYGEKLKAKQIELEFVGAPEDVQVRTNEKIFAHQVLGNILSNAIKFSLPGSKIRFKVERTADSVLISIQDFGIGIPNDIAQNIYKLDRKASRLGTSGEEGTGFGIPIAKAFTEKLGGTLYFESNALAEVGLSGTTFFIKFDL